MLVCNKIHWMSHPHIYAIVAYQPWLANKYRWADVVFQIQVIQARSVYLQNQLLRRMRSLTLLSLRNLRKQIRNLSLNRDQVQAEAENPLGPDLVSLEGFGLFHFLFMGNKFDSHTLQIAIIEITIP